MFKSSQNWRHTFRIHEAALPKRIIVFQATYIGYEALIQARAARSPKFAAKLKKMRGE